MTEVRENRCEAAVKTGEAPARLEKEVVDGARRCNSGGVVMRLRRGIRDLGVPQHRRCHRHDSEDHGSRNHPAPDGAGTS